MVLPDPVGRKCVHHPVENVEHELGLLELQTVRSYVERQNLPFLTEDPAMSEYGDQISTHGQDNSSVSSQIFPFQRQF